MEISAIGAFNPNKINWRSLTAKEILKYQKQGVEVPNLYVQWAQEFLRNVEKYDNDDVTYENAKSAERHKSKEVGQAQTGDVKEDEQAQAAQANVNAAPEIQPQTNTQTGDTTSQNEKETSPSAAQQKRQEMVDNKVSLRNQAISFTADSKQTGEEAKAAETLMNELNASSENEIQVLESTMKSLLSEAEEKQSELKNEVANINNGHSDHSTFAKIEKLQKELEQYGTTAQSDAAQTENTLNGYGTEIEGGTEIFSNASDFGSVTETVGNEYMDQLRKSPFAVIYRNLAVARAAISTGEASQENAQRGVSAQSDARSTNIQSKAQVSSIKNEIEQKTGVPAANKKEEGSASEQNPLTGKEQGSLKDVKTSQNDGTDTTDKLNISLDELVKRKVRRGDYSKEV